MITIKKLRFTWICNPPLWYPRFDEGLDTLNQQSSDNWFSVMISQVLLMQEFSWFNPIHNLPKLHIASTHPINFGPLQVLASGTQTIKNKGSKKNGLMISQSTKDRCFKYRFNFEIMMTVSGHTILLKLLRYPFESFIFSRVVFTLNLGFKSGLIFIQNFWISTLPWT